MPRAVRCAPLFSSERQARARENCFADEGGPRAAAVGAAGDDQVAAQGARRALARLESGTRASASAAACARASSACSATT
eukprot:4273006-Pleurochrysis_carterae.AAC.4